MVATFHQKLGEKNERERGVVTRTGYDANSVNKQKITQSYVSSVTSCSEQFTHSK